jgi:DNA-directed RNA polymerase subunit RPC12/RpoP
MAKKKPVQRMVQCYHCDERFEVSAKAMTVSCPACSRALMVEDVVIKTTHAVRKLQTCGRIVIQKKARVIADLVVGQEGIEVMGILEAKMVKSARVHVRTKGRWQGDCEAHHVIVDAGGAVTQGNFVISIPEFEPAPELVGV